jgi:hypothetical protein
MLAHQRRMDGGVLYHSDWSRRAAGIPVCHSLRDLITPVYHSVCPLDEPRRHNPPADCERRQLFSLPPHPTDRALWARITSSLRSSGVLLLGAGASAAAGVTLMKHLVPAFDCTSTEEFFQEIRPLSPRERFRQLFEYLQTDDPFRLTAGYQALGALVGTL